MGEVGLEKDELESRKQTVHPHSSWGIKIPGSTLIKNKAARLHNSIFVKWVPTQQHCRLYVDVDGKEGREEIGDGYNVGPGRFRYFHYYFYCSWPGHGMIVWEGADGVRVDQAAGRRFLRAHDPWKPCSVV